MPELPEVESVRRGLRPAMEGARFETVVARRPDLRFALPENFVSRLEGTTVRALDRRAKYLLARLSSGEVLVMHLGMSGSFRVEQPRRAAKDAKGRVRKGTVKTGGSKGSDRAVVGEFHRERGTAANHDHIVFEMSSGATVTFNDPRRFGSMTIVPGDDLDADAALAGLGPEPLAPAFDAAVLARACRGKKTTLKVALLDQRVVAGLGNIYASEALHVARLSPKRRASTIATTTGVPRDAAVRLVEAIKAVLNAAIERSKLPRGEGDRPDGELGYFSHRFRVYDRDGERCLRRGCGGTIARIVQAGRSTFFCPVCQK